jgi:hypothetical protein
MPTISASKSATYPQLLQGILSTLPLSVRSDSPSSRSALT